MQLLLYSSRAIIDLVGQILGLAAGARPMQNLINHHSLLNLWGCFWGDWLCDNNVLYVLASNYIIMSLPHHRYPRQATEGEFQHPLCNVIITQVKPGIEAASGNSSIKNCMHGTGNLAISFASLGWCTSSDANYSWSGPMLHNTCFHGNMPK